MKSNAVAITLFRPEAIKHQITQGHNNYIEVYIPSIFMTLTFLMLCIWFGSLIV